jgi:hypothetical protein
METADTVPSQPFRQGDNPLHTRIKGHVMLKQKKFRQATLIVIATAVILILPNLTRIFS